MPIRLFLSLCVFLVVPALSFAWQGKADNKPVDELSLMDENELLEEVMAVCRVSVSGRVTAGQHPNLARFNLKTLGIKEEALQYVSTIGRVATQKHHGTHSDWIVEMLQGISSDNSLQCVRVYREVREVWRQGLLKK
jgi:hypothetical protein